ncbi:hypothetical protein SEPCBS119000_005700 [Sporothrix epigloea]|uniref:Uncharacterized protein n=1 Tax=Sporothrix epigloea TaxID=1892477 RepID=A0ABP0E0W8_9PEZI
MARKLPWERISGNAGPASKPRQTASSARRSFSPAPSAEPSDRSVKDNDRGRTPRQLRRSQLDATGRYRSPSTSPPPAPPTESFMIDGLDNDDRYRMVEDELLAIARLFTAHLHAAEYQRLRARAKSQTATPQSMARPVTTVIPTERVARKQAVTKLRAKQKAALREFKGIPEAADGNGKNLDEDEAQTGSVLEDLMESGPSNARLPLASLAPLVAEQPASRSTPRRAAREAKYEDDDDDDDLDGPVTKSKPTLLAPAVVRDASRPQRTLDAGDRCLTGSVAEKKSVSFANETRQVTIDRYEASQAHEMSENATDDDEEDLDTDNFMQLVRKRREKEKTQRLVKQQRRYAIKAREDCHRPG